MFQIFLVDDEWLELDTLEHFVPWEELGFKVAGTAKNGKEALLKIEQTYAQKQLLPDVILTDVKMPVMDGIAFSKEIHCRYPHIHFVFLSGYNDFEYVRGALRVEACGYFLKPLDIGEIREMMEEVYRKCCNTVKQQKSDAAFTASELKKLLDRQLVDADAPALPFDSLSDDIRLSCNRLLHCPPDNRTFYYQLITIDDYRFLLSYHSEGSQILSEIQASIQSFLALHHTLALNLDDSQYFLLSCSDLRSQTENWQRKHLCTAQWTTACCRQTPAGIDKLSENYTLLSRLRQFHIRLCGSGHTISCGQTGEAAASSHSAVRSNNGILISLIQQYRKEEALLWLERYISGIPRDDNQLQTSCLELLDHIYAIIVLPNRSLSDIAGPKTWLYNQLSSLESRTRCQEVLQQFITRLMDHLMQQKGDHRAELILQVKEMIDTAYASPLTIEYLAESIHMSPNYLRTLFKEYTGQTVLEYMTEVRINQAIRLLTCTNLRIHEISGQIGYENPSHFCAVFHKRLGLTPNQFRDKAAKEKNYAEA